MINIALAKRLDSVFKSILLVCVSITIATTVAVTILMATESFHFFERVPFFDFLFGTKWEPLLEPKSFGVLPLVSGTMFIVVGSIFLALPIGLAVAIYLSEYANHRLREVVKPVIEVLAGIPTVVYGFFALTFVTPVLKIIFPNIEVFNALSGAIVVGVMILPMISSLCDDAFRAVPVSLREGAYAVGATKNEVIVQVLIPAAKSRIGASLILAISRAIGETMAVTLAAGATPVLLANPLESIQTMTAFIVQVSLGDTPAGGIEYLTCFAVGGLLFVITLMLNIVGARIMRTQYRL
jgi:phosphate transport system permease protein